MKAWPLKALRPLFQKHSLEFWGFPNHQYKTKNILMLAHEAPDGGVSHFEVLDSCGSKLAKEEHEQLSAQGNRRWRRFWYCHGQASDAGYQSSEESPLDVRQPTPPFLRFAWNFSIPCGLSWHHTERCIRAYRSALGNQRSPLLHNVFSLLLHHTFYALLSHIDKLQPGTMTSSKEHHH